ncbi:MAG: hypothetical protein ACOZBL_05505 [Patescibacteria group bacterium]
MIFNGSFSSKAFIPHFGIENGLCSKSTFQVSLSISYIGKSVTQVSASSSLSTRLYLSLIASLTALKAVTAGLNSFAEKNIISHTCGLNILFSSLISSSEKNFSIGDLAHSAS